MFKAVRRFMKCAWCVQSQYGPGACMDDGIDVTRDCTHFQRLSIREYTYRHIVFCQTRNSVCIYRLHKESFTETVQHTETLSVVFMVQAHLFTA